MRWEKENISPVRARTTIPKSAIIAAAVLAQAGFGLASAHVSLEVHDLAQLSLDQLSNAVVTTVSRHEQSPGSAAASIYVITAEDIRRSGTT